ncbi:BamA/TamA family outer membrane protein [Cruoricaptor ignavus]|uniref:translocation and assembly module lipoprotein TamL n=1 Tax=Cruoricaptor ignavus TaxID=1118202 RepID=UPI00370DCFC7
MKVNNKTYIFQVAGAAAILSAATACGPQTYLKEGETLYTGAKVEIINDTMSKRQKNKLRDGIQEKLRPKPNSSFLGMHPRLSIYGMVSEPKKDKGFKYWLKYRLGEVPITMGDVDRDFNRDIARNYSENKGYFNARAKYDTEEKNRMAKVTYEVKPGVQYLINEVTYQQDSSLVSSEIKKMENTSLLKKGDAFDLDVVKAERNRIDGHMKENGFYYFHPDNLVIQADSTVTGRPRVDMNLKLKENTPEISRQQFTIDKVIVFADYSLQGRTRNNLSVPMTTDSTQFYKKFYIVDPDHKFKPKIFERALMVEPGEIYNRADHNLSLNRLISLGTFQFVKNQFVVSDSANSKFDAYYLLTPRAFQSLRVEATGKTNSASYVGSEINVNWTHRNAFRGAELLKAAVYGAFDVQVGGKRDREANNIYRVGGNVSLAVPRLLVPFRVKSSSAYVPKTFTSIGYEFQNRTQLYTLHNFSGSFGYLWKENARKEHELKLLDVTVVAPQKVTAKFDSIAAGNPYMRRVVERQLIYGPTYSYTYTNTMLPKKTTIYYKGMADLAGNLSGLISGANAEEGKQKKIFGTPFSQYAKMEHDVRLYHRVGEKSQIAARLDAGIAYPYGNSEFIPFSRQFFVGGSNSIRAFRARTLGPGSYDPNLLQSSFYADQAGDIKLEANLEYRANLYKFLNAAIFADAGNIWLVNEDVNRPGAKFSKDWAKEIAVGAGFGLRLDFNILVLRLDLAMPLRVPYYPDGERWAFSRIDFGNSDWRKDNLILNIAIGYPF